MKRKNRFISLLISSSALVLFCMVSHGECVPMNALDKQSHVLYNQTSKQEESGEEHGCKHCQRIQSIANLSPVSVVS